MIYLDNAATSFPKPESVYAAMDRFARESCGNPGRGGHRLAVESQKVVTRARRAVAALFGAPGPERVIFTLNATDAINIGIKGVVRPGDHVVSTTMEHNSVARCLTRLERDRVSVTRDKGQPDGLVRATDILAAVRPETRLVAMVHASNVVGTVQPIGAVAEALQGTGTLLLVDAAQSAGVLPIDVRAEGIDLLAFAGHKGVLGPTGTGVLVLGERAEPEPLKEGGTGTTSESIEHPRELPERLEAGTVNCIGLAGLLAGVRYLEERSVEHVGEHERELGALLHELLDEVPGVTLYGPRDFSKRVGVVSFTVEGVSPQDMAAVLDTSFDIAVRAGLHCAPLAHATLGTPPGGTVRMSPGPFTTASEIRSAAEAVAAIAESAG